MYNYLLFSLTRLFLSQCVVSCVVSSVASYLGGIILRCMILLAGLATNDSYCIYERIRGFFEGTARCITQPATL